MSHDRILQRHILEVLGRQPEHGYGIAQQILSRTKGLLDGRESLLYPSLYALEGAGVIDSYLNRAADYTHRYYRLTDKGKGQLARLDSRQRHESSAVRTPILGES